MLDFLPDLAAQDQATGRFPALRLNQVIGWTSWTLCASFWMFLELTIGRPEELQERHPILGWIGALGLEFVRDRRTKEPAADEAAWMLEFCAGGGLLFELDYRRGQYREPSGRNASGSSPPWAREPW